MDQSNHAWKSDIYIVRKEACLPGNNQTLLESTYSNLIKWSFLFEKEHSSEKVNISLIVIENRGYWKTDI
jgi:hypothetical protein